MYDISCMCISVYTHLADYYYHLTRKAISESKSDIKLSINNETQTNTFPCLLFLNHFSREFPIVFFVCIRGYERLLLRRSIEIVITQVRYAA